MSDLLRAAGGLLAPVSGRVHATGGKPGFVWRDPVLLPWRTVAQNVTLGAELSGLPETPSRERARYLLGLLDAPGIEDRLPGGLSAALSVRAALARALLHKPQLLLLDNPFGRLDCIEREQIWMDLQRVWMTERFAALLATTEINEAVQLADRVVILSDRPARVLETVDIDLPRPRRLHRATSTRMTELADGLRTILKAQGTLS